MFVDLQGGLCDKRVLFDEQTAPGAQQKDDEEEAEDDDNQLGSHDLVVGLIPGLFRVIRGLLGL